MHFSFCVIFSRVAWQTTVYITQYATVAIKNWCSLHARERALVTPFSNIRARRVVQSFCVKEHDSMGIFHCSPCKMGYSYTKNAWNRVIVNRELTCVVFLILLRICIQNEGHCGICSTKQLFCLYLFILLITISIIKALSTTGDRKSNTATENLHECFESTYYYAPNNYSIHHQKLCSSLFSN